MYLMVYNRRFTPFNYYIAEHYEENDNFHLIKRFRLALNY